MAGWNDAPDSTRFVVRIRIKVYTMLLELIQCYCSGNDYMGRVLVRTV